METKRHTLEDIGNRVPFTVPENYFSEVNKTIMANLPEKEPAVIAPVTLWDKTKPWVYMAAMFFGLFFTIRVLVTTSTPTSIANENFWSDVEISEEEFFDYIEDQFVEESYYNLVNNQDYLNSL